MPREVEVSSEESRENDGGELWRVVKTLDEEFRAVTILFYYEGMQRVAVMDTMDDTVNLELYTGEIFQVRGQWHIPVCIDKSSVAAESLTVSPKIKARVTTGWNKEYSHDITVEKVSISPFGSQIVLSERGENPFCQFALRDEKGNYLPVVPAVFLLAML